MKESDLKPHVYWVVLLTWLDACSCHDWHDKDDKSCANVMTIQTMGWVRAVTDRQVLIQSSQSTDREHASQITAIPIVCVTSIARLYEKENHD